MILKVHFNDGPLVGQLAEDRNGRIWFQYDAAWLRSGVNLSPVNLPFTGSPTPGLDNPTFQGLHGLFYDSLPDYWGSLLLDQRLRMCGVEPENVSPLVRLSYIGSRGMGALSYQPSQDETSDRQLIEAVSLAQADHEATLMMEGKPLEGSPEEILGWVQAGSSAGGAKPKVHAWVQGDTVHIGADRPEGFEPWIIKLSSVPTGHKDSGQRGRVEYAYSLMAKAAGLDMPESRLFEVEAKHGKRGLFGVKRFDREHGHKIHMHSLAGLLHQDFNGGGAYEDLARATLALTRDSRSLDEVFRRLAFNVAALNCDDHTKNFAFLLERAQWRLSPAFDLTQSPGIRTAGHHALSVNRSVNPTRNDLMAFASAFGMERADDILAEVVVAVENWKEFAEKAGLRTANVLKIGQSLEAALSRLSLL